MREKERERERERETAENKLRLRAWQLLGYGSNLGGVYLETCLASLPRDIMYGALTSGTLFAPLQHGSYRAPASSPVADLPSAAFPGHRRLIAVARSSVNYPVSRFPLTGPPRCRQRLPGQNAFGRDEDGLTTQKALSRER